jgi:hypothetical protein
MPEAVELLPLLNAAIGTSDRSREVALRRRERPRKQMVIAASLGGSTSFAGRIRGKFAEQLWRGPPDVVLICGAALDVMTPDRGPTDRMH